MSESDNAIEQLRRALARHRPTVRPYLLAAIWLFLLISIGWDIKRYLGDHPRSLSGGITFYTVMLAAIVFDLVMERKYRREKADNDSD